MEDFLITPLAGGAAGFVVDMTLYPVDTIKTRLQSRQKFWKAGGFKSLYKGVGPAAAGSIPSAALFFLTYELIKKVGGQGPAHYAPLLHMGAAATGELVSNFCRVPFEAIKQRSQVNLRLSPLFILRDTLKVEGLRGLYRGYVSTVFREVPFSFIQYPVWEHLKALWSKKQGGPLSPWQGAVCGAFAGGTAAAITTPLDVAKTRIMLAKQGEYETLSSIIKVMTDIVLEEGALRLFAGFVPRVGWISVGGFVFLGTYEKVSHTLNLCLLH